MTQYQLLAFSSAADGQDDALDTWYETEHVPDMLAIDGFLAVRRFRLIDAGPPPPASQRFLAVYDVEAESPGVILQTIGAAAGSGAIRMSDALDTANSGMAIYEAISETHRADPPTEIA